MAERAMGGGWPRYATHQEVMCFQCQTIPTDNSTMVDTMPNCTQAETIGLDIGRYHQTCPMCELRTFYDIGTKPLLRVV